MGGAPEIIIVRNQKLKDAEFQYRDDPEAFSADVLGLILWDKLVEYLWSVAQHQNTALKACFASSKTFGLAAICLWFLFTRYNSKVVTTAPTRRQVRDLLWADIASLHAHSKITLGGECLTERLQLGRRWLAVGFTANKRNQATFQGYHASGGLLYAIDEATGVAPNIFNARDRIIVSPEDRFVCIGNPTDPNCEFARAFKDPTFHKLQITAYETPNVRAGRTIIPGMMTVEWLRDKEARWKDRIPQLWLSMVMAEFPEGQDDALIPLSWIEAAMLRWETLREQQAVLDEARKILGIDVATTGTDFSVFAPRLGQWVEELHSYSGKDTQELAALAQIEHGRGYELAVDAIGVGAGVADALLQAGVPVHKVIGSAASDKKDSTGSFGFTNVRSELHWSMRERLDPAGPLPLALPRDELLREELAAPTWKPVIGGRVQVEPKDKVKEKLGRSPDRSDALINTLAVENFATPAYLPPAPSADRQQRQQHQPTPSTERKRKW